MFSSYNKLYDKKESSLIKYYTFSKRSYFTLFSHVYLFVFRDDHEISGDKAFLSFVLKNSILIIKHNGEANFHLLNRIISIPFMIYSKSTYESLNECRRVQMSHRRMQTSQQTSVDECTGFTRRVQRSVGESLDEYREMQTSEDESDFFIYLFQKK